MREESASSTAYTVLHGILHTAKKPALSHLVSIEERSAAESILSASAEGRKRLAQLNSPLKSKLLPFLEWLLLPGITLNYVLRKKFIEENLLQAIDEGVTQVVNIGAGFDTLAWRLSRKMPHLTFIEIDHPATGIEKEKAILQSGDFPPNLHLIAADLSKKKLEEVLKENKNFDPGKKTLYIAEGLLMYLNENDVKGLFEAVTRLTGSGSRILFSGMEPDESEKNNVRPLLHLYLRIKNERYNWYLRADEMPDFLEGCDYSLLRYADSDSYRQQYLPPAYSGTLHKGEYLILAEAR